MFQFVGEIVFNIRQTNFLYSYSNLACLNASSSNPTDQKKNQSQNSDDSSSSTEDDTRAVILTNDRGTSSLQLSDSDEERFQGIHLDYSEKFLSNSLFHYIKYPNS